MYKKLVYLNNKDVRAFNLYKKEREGYIKDKIKNAIHTQVYGEPKKEKKVEKAPVDKSTKIRKTKASASKNEIIKRKYTKKLKTEVKNDSNNTVSKTEVNENK